MKKILISFLFLFIITASYASDNNFNFLEKADDNYFIGGYAEHPVKFQLAVKTEIYDKSGVYLGYSETAFWDVNKKSLPFYDYNHSPYVEYSFRSKDNLLDADSRILDFISVGIRHKSNGQQGIYSRGINYIYGDGQSSLGRDYQFGLYSKYTYLINCSNKNKDYEEYNGQTEAKVFFKCLYFECYGKSGVYIGAANKDKIDYLYSYYKVSVPWIETGMAIRVNDDVFPELYIQWRYGYNESMLDYNKKENSVRIGLKL